MNEGSILEVRQDRGKGLSPSLVVILCGWNPKCPDLLVTWPTAVLTMEGLRFRS